jgi:hypothetical protein
MFASASFDSTRSAELASSIGFEAVSVVVVVTIALGLITPGAAAS